MQQITRSEKDWLISQNYLRVVRGRYENLTTCSKRGKGKKKTYYVTDYLAEKVRREMYGK